MSETQQLLFTLAHEAQKKAIRRRRKRQQAATRTPLRAKQANPPRLSPRQSQGFTAEDRARIHLEQAGLIVLQHNLRCQAGEIDLVCREGRQLVFVEVRQRLSKRHGGAAASVDIHKQKRLIRAANYHLPWLSRHFFDCAMAACRFDVIAIENGQLHWIKNAFSVPG